MSYNDKPPAYNNPNAPNQQNTEHFSNVPVCNPVNTSQQAGSFTIPPNNNMPVPINLNINIVKSKRNRSSKNGIQRERELHNPEHNPESSLRNSRIPLNVNTTLDMYLPAERSELYKFGIYLGVDIMKYPFCLRYILEAMNAPLPKHWIEKNQNGNIYFYNSKLNISSWDHPTDLFYKDLIIKEVKKFKKENSCSIL